jgi:hypothetical protein
LKKNITNVTHRITTNDPSKLISIVNGLTAHGGGDIPEASNAALIAAGQAMAYYGTVFFASDAPSHASGPTRQAVFLGYMPNY